MKDTIKELYKSSLQMTQATYNLAKLYNLTNTQEFLDWQDELNKISVNN